MIEEGRGEIEIGFARTPSLLNRVCGCSGVNLVRIANAQNVRDRSGTRDLLRSPKGARRFKNPCLRGIGYEVGVVVEELTVKRTVPSLTVLLEERGQDVDCLARRGGSLQC